MSEKTKKSLSEKLLAQKEKQKKLSAIPKEKKPELKTQEAAYDASYARKRSANFDEFSDSKKERVQARNQRKKQRYNEHKKRVDAKRERYADKMEGKGILTREQAMGRFDNLRGIKARSAEILQNTLDKDGEAPIDKNGDRKTGFSLNQKHISQGMSDLPEDPIYNESNPESRFMLDTESGFGNV